MSIRGIIEWLAEDMDGCDKDYGRGCALHCDIARISAEVALMEAVCEAAQEAMDDSLTTSAQGWCRVNVEPIYASLNALAAYRKERGL